MIAITRENTNMKAQTAAERIASRYIPAGYLPVTEDATLGVVYVGPLAGKYGAIAYRGDAGKRDWYCTFRSECLTITPYWT
jgi:hypothetical protein